MNQQRSRRFRSAQEREERQASKQALRAEFEAQGMTVPEEECVGQPPGLCGLSAIATEAMMNTPSVVTLTLWQKHLPSLPPGPSLTAT